MLRLIVAISAALALLIAGPAAAQSCQAPPGTAAVDEYCETIPAAGGDRGSTDPRAQVPLPAATARRLDKAGKDGEALLRQLGHDPARKPAAKDAPAPARDKGTAPAAPSDNPLDAVGAALASGPTLDGAFVVALLCVTLLMVTWGWIAYRRRTAGD